MEKVITGYWNGQPIWREKLPSDYLEEIVLKYEQEIINIRKQNGTPTNAEICRGNS